MEKEVSEIGIKNIHLAKNEGGKYIMTGEMNAFGSYSYIELVTIQHFSLQ